MTETAKKLGQVLLTGGIDTLYTVPAATSALVKNIHVVNTATVETETVQIWQSGSNPVNLILPPVSLGPGEFGIFDGAITMEAADTLMAYCGVTGTHIAVTVEGVEFS